MKVLQIATVGEDSDSVLIGIREYPVSKLVLIYLPEHEPVVRDIAGKLSFLKIEIERRPIKGQPIRELLQIISDVVNTDGSRFEDVYINVSSGPKLVTAAAVLSAYVNGLKAFYVEDDEVELLPVLKFTYSELISDSKMAILETLDKLGGEAESLYELSDNASVEKSLLSYHIRGGKDSKGLEELGLVEVDRATQGRLKIRLTMMGKLMLIGRKGRKGQTPVARLGSGEATA